MGLADLEASSWELSVNIREGTLIYRLAKHVNQFSLNQDCVMSKLKISHKVLMKLYLHRRKWDITNLYKILHFKTNMLPSIWQGNNWKKILNLKGDEPESMKKINKSSFTLCSFCLKYISVLLKK